MMDNKHKLMIRFIDALERFILRLFLHRRERIICPEFDRRLSREIDCLQTLIEGCKDED